MYNTEPEASQEEAEPEAVEEKSGNKLTYLFIINGVLYLLYN